MHTVEICDLLFHHNGDYYGDVEITDARSGEPICMLPFEAPKRFIAGYVRYKKIERLENSDPDELLLK